MARTEQKRILMEPLASKIRPTKIEDFVGQKHLVAPGKAAQDCA